MAISFIASTRGPSSFPAAANNTSSVVCNKPTGTVNGDLMLAYCQSGGGVNHSAPAGWTLLTEYENAGSLLTSTIFYRFASSEGASYTFTDDSGSATPMCVQLLTYRGVDPTNPINVRTESSTAGTDTVAAPSATSTALGWYVWFRTGKTATVASEGDFTITNGTARQKSSNRGSSTQYFVESADSNANLSIGSNTGASFNSSVTLTGSIERTVVLKAQPDPATGTLDASLAPVTSSVAGTVATPSGTIGATLAPVSASMTGIAAPPSGTLGATVTVSASMAGTIPPIATLATQLSPVVASFATETRPFGEHIIRVEAEGRAFRVIDEDPGLIPINRSEVTDA